MFPCTSFRVFLNSSEVQVHTPILLSLDFGRSDETRRGSNQAFPPPWKMAQAENALCCINRTRENPGEDASPMRMYKEKFGPAAGLPDIWSNIKSQTVSSAVEPNNLGCPRVQYSIADFT